MNLSTVLVEPRDLFLGLEDPARFRLRYGIENPSEYDIEWSTKHGRFKFTPKSSNFDDLFASMGRRW